MENKKKKTETPEYKVPPHFQWSEQQSFQNGMPAITKSFGHILQRSEAALRKHTRKSDIKKL